MMLFKRMLVFMLILMTLMPTAFAAAPTPTPTPAPTNTPIPTVPVFGVSDAEPTPLPTDFRGREQDLEDWYEWYYEKVNPIPNGGYKDPIYIIDDRVQFDEYNLPEPMGAQYALKTVEDFIDRTADENTLIFVDPVMGDDGKLYSACFPELVAEMRRLCARADIITPNLTEACLMTDTGYPDLSALSADEAEAAVGRIAEKIKSFTDAECVITGIHFKEGVGTYCLGRMHGERARRNDYPGTGDLFASVMLGFILKSGRLDKEILQKSAEYASRFTAEVIDYSLEYGSDEPRRDGVLLEGCLGRLIEDLSGR